jgi:glycerol dehydrogenase-like iron-containing ADH family enzyme
MQSTHVEIEKVEPETRRGDELIVGIGGGSAASRTKVEPTKLGLFDVLFLIHAELPCQWNC